MQQGWELDATKTPADIGAHLDLAIVRLGESMAQGPRSPELNASMPEPKAASDSAG